MSKKGENMTHWAYQQEEKLGREEEEEGRQKDRKLIRDGAFL